MLGVSMRPPKLPIWAKPTSSRRKMMTLGAPLGGVAGSGHHSFESSYLLAILPLNSPVLACAKQPSNEQPITDPAVTFVACLKKSRLLTFDLFSLFIFLSPKMYVDYFLNFYFTFSISGNCHVLSK
jgi:hypothetical protein